MDNNYHIPDLVQAYSYVENGGLNLFFFKLAKPHTCMTVAPNSIILTTICEQNKQTYWVNKNKVEFRPSILAKNIKKE